MVAKRDEVEFIIYRLDPTKDQEAYFVDYKVPVRPGMTVLDCLIHIQRELDPTLSVRYSCRFKICGSCAMLVDGVQMLACETQVSSLGSRIRVEPLPHFEVIKDLVVDIDPFLEQIEAAMPFIHPDPEVEAPRVDPEEFRKYRSPSGCIWCGACSSSCPIAASEPYFLGPAALAQIYRFVVDSRDLEETRRLRLARADSSASGVWRCHHAFTCAEVCPKDINPGQHIAQLRRLILRSRLIGRT
ncbi:succinate dehydrogenase [Candidatus Bathyarchaeota archaeon]|jgi:succinate dehydrogenase / fumarate reductase iron-sulfur subunit|nr:succinate dehydrogenase [Candidatus Bathyarchaeota archaeon]MDP6048512.1 succinate dehydrogenase/fumarate reductase iron-sulfur subunit [Candidatus Bathyarchaeota archaeon]MDP7207249.1 succinate dehydrogenase/fumarate reductase iron-sulfur subunit [Candidatus Bathyarchaeota archaeon]MDP7442903.1 succinate dehydrogenase/fumarate reductase iron-sulfur subunit [Candidatus Bathyarchaeota archaeon]|tara:strand:+ start:4154 stop:4882 length:729 start_codon:yes stop_codon:yes gene_type:complete